MFLKYHSFYRHLAVAGILSARLTCAHEVGLETSSNQVRLSAGAQSWLFHRVAGGWALNCVEVDGKAVAKPLIQASSFCSGSGSASRFDIITNTPDEKAVRFIAGTNTVTYGVRRNEPLPAVHLSWEGPSTITCAWQTTAEAVDEHGAWVTRGYVATDAEQHEDFIDGSGPAVFSHYLALMFLDRFERSSERRFLDLARDMVWIHILTTCTTSAKDNKGQPLTGTTCVGIRGCVDYDCAPNLCHEKDLTFVHTIGPLLDHVQGAAYAKYITLNRLALAKDSWTSAWTADLRDTNLRTMYDTFARGMANLIYALSTSSDPWVIPLDTLVSKGDTNIVCRRDLVLSNGTASMRKSKVQIRFLLPGDYAVQGGDQALGPLTAQDLDSGLWFNLAPNEMRFVRVRAIRLQPLPEAARNQYAAGTFYLSDLQPYASQRGTANPQPAYQQDKGIDGQPMHLGGQACSKGLGCAANTVLVYDLDRQYERFKALVGVDDFVAGRTNPPPSVAFTVHVDGRLQFESGAMFSNTPPRLLDVDVRHARKLMLRTSCNWDNGGQSQNDHGNWANARLEGKAILSN